jgi:hypothetical protein
MPSLDEAFRAWRDAPFPRGSVVDALDEAKADLVLHDSWVAESVIPFVEHGRWEPAVPDVLGALDRLMHDVAALDAAGTRDQEAAAGLRSYAALLREVYVAFLAEGEA